MRNQIPSRADARDNMLVKNKAKNICVHMQQRSVSVPHIMNARIQFIQTKQKQKHTYAPSKAHKM
jgi:hypothetical protein